MSGKAIAIAEGRQQRVFANVQQAFIGSDQRGVFASEVCARIFPSFCSVSEMSEASIEQGLSCVEVIGHFSKTLGAFAELLSLVDRSKKGLFWPIPVQTAETIFIDRWVRDRSGRELCASF